MLSIFRFESKGGVKKDTTISFVIMSSPLSYSISRSQINFLFVNL